MTPIERFAEIRDGMDRAMRASAGPIPQGYTLTVIPLARAVFGHDGEYYYGHMVNDQPVVERLLDDT